MPHAGDPPAPPPGTFALYPFAEPPVPAGAYLLGGAVSGLPGDVAPLGAQVHVTAPRYALPPDQILSTFPPAGARGAFGSRLPQLVLRRRTLPWERSPDLDADVGTTPTPWLALVLVAEGEGTLLTGVPVGDTVTAGVQMGDDTDVPSGACLEVPREVVAKVFPTREDLALLCHVRAVDLADTELALGDDDGWLAVVMANRLPQPGVRYLACLVNVEQQYGALPTIPDVSLVTSYLPVAAVVDVRAAVHAEYGDTVAFDTMTMHLPPFGPAPSGPAPAPSGPAPGAAPGPRPAVDAQGTTVSPARGAPARTGAAWAGAALAAVQPSTPDAGTRARMVLADGFAFPAALVGPLRFPVLAYWSFTCDDGGDFQYLATNVHTRMLGHVVTARETPDGDALGPDDPPQAGIAPEPGPTRPLPLVTATGHVQLDHVSRDGEPAPAWFRGPLAPAAVPRAGGDPPPLAHVADQLRRVTPDGQEDLGYAAAFELGRLLALAQPGVVAALSRWRAEAFGAARVRAVVEDAAAQLPDDVRSRLAAPDPLADGDGDRARTLGARAARAVVDLLGTDPGTALGPFRPPADPGVAAEVLGELHAGGDRLLLAGLGVPAVTPVDDPALLLAQLGRAPAAAAVPDPAARTALLRQRLEDTAGALADAALGRGSTGDAPDRLARAAREPDALDQLIDRARRREER